MAGKNYEPSFEDAPEEEEEQGLDLERVREIVGFVLRSPKRHRGLSIGLFLVGIVLTVMTVAVFPRTYSSDARLLVQKNRILPALGNPGIQVPHDEGNRSAADVVSERSNIIALIKQVNLVDRWEAQKTWVQRAKDSVFKKISAPLSEEDKLRGLVGIVEKKLNVQADDSNVNIAVDWSNPEMAYELVATVQKNFLEAKYDPEVGMINDAIAILQTHLATENDNIGVALSELIAAQALAASPGKTIDSSGHTVAVTGGAHTGSSSRGPSAASTARATELAGLLEERRNQVKKLEESRDQQIADLNRQLSTALTTLTPAHPSVVAIKERLEDAEKPQPQIEALKSDTRAIVAQIAAAATTTTTTAGSPAAPAAAPSPASGGTGGGGGSGGASGDTMGGFAPASGGMPLFGSSSRDSRDSREARDRDDPPAVSVAKYKLANATQKYTDLQSRIDSARIELDIARAAFKYRLVVLHPAEMPKGARKPNVPVLALGGFFASLVIAIVAAVVADLATGRFIETSQVSRGLSIPLLGEVDPP